jgi:putative exosortase-associated protein (TIGR04073 family)
MRNIINSTFRSASMPLGKPTLSLVAGAIALFAVAAHAEEDSGISYPARIGGKLGIGFINATTGIVEIPKSIIVESTKENIWQGMSVGLVKGMTNMVARSFLGMLDVVSFPIPTKPLVTPAVVFQDFSTETTYGTGWETY